MADGLRRSSSPAGDDSRRAVVAATRALLDEGAAFAEVSVRQICERAGLGRTAFYGCFERKESVLAMLHGELVIDVAVAAERTRSGHPRLLSMRGAVAMATEMMSVLREHEAVFRAVVAVDYLSSPVRQDYWHNQDAVVGLVVQAFAEAGRASEQAPVPDLSTTARTTVAMMVGAFREQLVYGDPARDAVQARAVGRAAWLILGNGPAVNQPAPWRVDPHHWPDSIMGLPERGPRSLAGLDRLLACGAPFHDVPLDQIADAIDVPLPTLRLRLGEPCALLATLLRSGLGEEEARIRRVLDEWPRGVPFRIADALQILCSAGAQAGHVWRAAVEAAPVDPAVAHIVGFVTDSVTEALAAALRAEREAGAVVADLAEEETATAVVQMLSHGMYRQLVHGPGADDEGLQAMLVRSAWMAIYGDAPTPCDEAPIARALLSIGPPPHTDSHVG